MKQIITFVVLVIIIFGGLFLEMSHYWNSCRHNPEKKIICIGNEDCHCVDRNVPVMEIK
jgi:hypothetical protein